MTACYVLIHLNLLKYKINFYGAKIFPFVYFRDSLFFIQYKQKRKQIQSNNNCQNMNNTTLGDVGLFCCCKILSALSITRDPFINVI